MGELCLLSICASRRLKRRCQTKLLASLFIGEKVTLGDKYGAISDFTETIRLDSKNIKPYILRGLAKFDIGDKYGAISDFTEAVRINPRNSEAYLMRGMVKEVLGDVYGSISDYTEVIRFNPESGKAYFSRGTQKLTIGDRKGAARDIAKAAILYKQQGNTVELELLNIWTSYRNFVY